MSKINFTTNLEKEKIFPGAVTRTPTPGNAFSGAGVPITGTWKSIS
jgi:hypothetical protein